MAYYLIGMEPIYKEQSDRIYWTIRTLLVWGRKNTDEPQNQISRVDLG